MIWGKSLSSQKISGWIPIPSPFQESNFFRFSSIDEKDIENPKLLFGETNWWTSIYVKHPFVFKPRTYTFEGNSFWLSNIKLSAALAVLLLVRKNIFPLKVDFSNLISDF